MLVSYRCREVLVREGGVVYWRFYYNQVNFKFYGVVMGAINLKSIGGQIKALREKIGFSHSQIADFLDLDQSYISNIENGERIISVDLLEKIASLLGCNIGYFTNKESDYQPIPFALRVRGITSSDLKTIAKINKIALNLRYMSDVIVPATKVGGLSKSAIIRGR